MKKVLVVCLLLVALAVSCGGGGNGDSKAIKDTIRGYVTTFNAEDFVQCLTYFTDYGDDEDAISELTFWRGSSGELTLASIGKITIEDSTATAEVTYTIAGQTDTQLMKLRKEGSSWKILWEQETLTGDFADIRDTIVSYLAAYNAGDFNGCLSYLTGFDNAQEVTGSLLLIKEHIGTVTYRQGGAESWPGPDRAEGVVAYNFWSTAGYQCASFRKEAGVWKIECGHHGFIMCTGKRLIPGTVEIPPDLSGVLEAKCVGFEGDDGESSWAWCAWQVQNTGTQTLQFEYGLEYTFGLYDKDGSNREGGGSFLGNRYPLHLEPGKAEGSLHVFGPHPLDTISYFKVTLEHYNP